MRGRDERGEMSLSSTARTVGLVVLAIATAVIVYLAVTKDNDPPAASETSTGSEPLDPSGSATVDAETPPVVDDALRVDFSTDAEVPTTVDDIPFATYDNAAVGSPLTVTDGLLTHAAPVGKLAIGSLEATLPGPVQKIGGVVSFPIGNAGSAYLIGWQNSLVAARDAGQPVPKSGLRLEVSYGTWALSTYDKTEQIIAGDEYEPTDGALQQFEVYRSEDRAWVVDPAGVVTSIQNDAIGELTGNFACWQVAEESTKEKPVGFQSIWAG